MTNIYLRWFEVFLLPLIFSIGVACWLQTGNNNIVGYFILFSILYLFALLWLNERRIRDKSDESYIDSQESFTESLGYRLNEYEVKMDINIYGGVIETRTFELEVLEGMLASKDYHWDLSGDKTFGDYTVEVSKIEGESDISSKIVQKTPQAISIVVEFSPALKKGDKIKYEISEKVEKGMFAMTQEEIIDCIRQGTWLFDEAYEFCGYMMGAPTKKYTFITLLPKDYKITTKDDFWDVIFQYSSNRNFKEYERLQKEKCFSRGTLKEKQMLKLSVDNPKMGLTYITKWKPPSKKEYEQLLGGLNKRDT